MINWTDKMLAGGIGIVDELVGDWDAGTVPARTEPFKKAQDLVRLAAVAGGLALQSFAPRQAAIGDTMSTAALPLLVKSVWGAVAAQRTSKRVTYAPTTRAVPTSYSPPPPGTPSGYRPL